MSLGRKPYPAQAGEKFGRLTLIADSYLKQRSESGPTKCSYVRARCECGTVKEYRLYSLRTGNTNSCGCFKLEQTGIRQGEAHWNWKGGRIHVSGGYIKIKAPDHPAADCNGYVPEHRLVMEKIQGRYLEPGETVHHINGVRDDNDPGNLQLRVGNHGKAQAYACSDCGSDRIHPVPLADDPHVTTYKEA